jgi:hypothetical protein
MSEVPMDIKQLTLQGVLDEHKPGGKLFFKRKGEDGVRQLPLFI